MIPEEVKVCMSDDNHGSFTIVGHEESREWITEVKDLLAIPI